MSRVRKPAAIAGRSIWPPTWAAAALLAMAIFAVYGPAINAPFIFDDNSAVIDNKSIVSLWPLIGTAEHPGPLNPPRDLPTASRPVVNLSFAINYYFGKLNPAGYHAVNVVLHCVSAPLLLAIVRRTLRLPYFGDRFERSADWLALAVAMLWALHPLQTEAVIYATQRTELMMALFYLATLYCSLRYWSLLPLPAGERRVGPNSPARGEATLEQDEHSQKRRRAFWLTLAIVACAAGMASKEVMVSAPLIVFLFDRAFVSGSLLAALRRSWPLYAGLAATWLVLLALNWNQPRGETAGFHLGMPLSIWWFTQAKVLLMYLKLAVWPWPLILHYQLPYEFNFSTAWIYVLPVAALVLGTLVLLWRNHPVGFLGTWLLAILSPTLVVPIISEMAAERRMYLPLAALVVAAVVGGYQLAQRIGGRAADKSHAGASANRPLVAIASATILVTLTFGVVSAKRLEMYHDEFKLWADVVRHEPENHVAHQNLGLFLHKAGKTEEAIEHYREAVRLSPDSAQAHYSLGLLLINKGAFAEAVEDFQEAVRYLPNDAGVRNNLAVALFNLGRNDEAIAQFRETLKLDPNRWVARINLGLALQKAGQYQEALNCFDQTLKANPKEFDIYNEVANTYALMNQREKAIATLEHARELARAAGDNQMVERFTDRLKASQ